MKKSLINERRKECICIVTFPIAKTELVPVENGKKFVAENSTWDRVVEGIEGVYEDCIRDL